MKNKLTKTINNYLDKLFDLRIQPSPEKRLNKSRAHILNKFKIENVLDVGANQGQWAFRVRKNGYLKNITSFEPTSEFEVLKRNTIRDSKWDCINMAVSNHIGESKMYMASNKNHSSSILQPDEILQQGFEMKFYESKNVPTTTIDEYFKNSKISNFYLKMDVQGAENLVLEGAEKSLANCVAVEFESSFRSLYKGEINHYELARWLIIRDFLPYQVVVTHWDLSMATVSLDSIFVKNLGRLI